MISLGELEEYATPQPMLLSAKAYGSWTKKWEPEDNIDNDAEQVCATGSKYISFDELTALYDIANLLDPAGCDEVFSIFSVEIRLVCDEVKHKDSEWFRGVCILPVATGEYEVE